MTPDCELLRQYARTQSETAFAELVQRHVNLVHSAALRQVNGDAHLAQDVAQTVFADLARKAASLARRGTLTGWLYTSTHFAAAKAVRTENRRRDHEEKSIRSKRDSANGLEIGNGAALMSGRRQRSGRHPACCRARCPARRIDPRKGR